MHYGHRDWFVTTAIECTVVSNVALALPSLLLFVSRAFHVTVLRSIDYSTAPFPLPDFRFSIDNTLLQTPPEFKSTCQRIETPKRQAHSARTPQPAKRYAFRYAFSGIEPLALRKAAKGAPTRCGWLLRIQPQRFHERKRFCERRLIRKTTENRVPRKKS